MVSKPLKFFISYNQADRDWAEWIAWQLEEAGHGAIIQDWDFRPGENFVVRMQRTAQEADRTIAVLSQNYLDAEFTHPEWAAAFRQDPQGVKRQLVPVRTRECKPEGVLGPIVYIDLVDLQNPNEARKRLLEGLLYSRNKPVGEPEYPGSISTGPSFPGTVEEKRVDNRDQPPLKSFILLVLLVVGFGLFTVFFSEYLSDGRRHFPGQILDSASGIRFRYIPARAFTMGSPGIEIGRREDEVQREVVVNHSFWMSQTEITQGQWKAIANANPSHFLSCGPDCPVEMVSWYDAVWFTNSLSEDEGLEACYLIEECNGTLPGDGVICDDVTFKGVDCEGYRLPTEEEWELAVRADTVEAIYRGNLEIYGLCDAPSLDGIAWYGGNSRVTYPGGAKCFCTERYGPSSRCGPHPVAGKAPNPWGLFDMLGNVWEWTTDTDLLNLEQEERADVDRGAVSESRVVRGGGSWQSNADRCRAAARASSAPNTRRGYLGFRIVKTES